MNLVEQKNHLRKIFKEKRKDLTAKEVLKSSTLIADNFINNLLPKIYEKNSGKVFALYLDSANEVQTAKIAKFFTENNIKFSYPKIISLNEPLKFVTYNNQKFTANQFFPKILEPENGEEILPDIIILPLVAFDHNLQRLGMGGGFFDRTIESLKKEKSKIITIALAYELQRFKESIPIENTDQALDFIVCEKNIFTRT
jgi:5-formyltetrahydrofolate cyclo-ligase